MKIGRRAPSGSGTAGTVLTIADTPAPATHPCATCGKCCRSYLVPVYGNDLWLIARRMHLTPSQFVVAWQEEGPSLDGFRLDPDGPLYSLVLDKRDWTRADTPCLFLLRLPGGHDRCGIYESRPVSCRAYPMELEQQQVTLKSDRLCPPDAWPVDEPANPAWRRSLQAAQMALDVYHVVVERWNAHVRTVGGGFELDDFYAYVLRSYDLLDARLDPDAQGRAQDGWRQPSSTPLEPAPWQRHLDIVRTILIEAAIADPQEGQECRSASPETRP